MFEPMMHWKVAAKAIAKLQGIVYLKTNVLLSLSHRIRIYKSNWIVGKTY